MTPAPIPDSYWVERGRFLAGEYPGGPDEAASRRRLARFGEAGVTFFLDLTEEGERGLVPYAPLLDEGIRVRRHAVRDLDSPTRGQMADILDTIDGALAAGDVVYLHCYGGLGRTGAVVGCWLVRHGRTGEEALAELTRLRAELPDPWPSPETEPQRELVLGWSG